MVAFGRHAASWRLRASRACRESLAFLIVSLHKARNDMHVHRGKTKNDWAPLRA